MQLKLCTTPHAVILRLGPVHVLIAFLQGSAGESRQQFHIARPKHTFHDNVIPDCITLRRFHLRVS